jgi:hypothetical protein
MHCFYKSSISQASPSYCSSILSFNKYSIS